MTRDRTRKFGRHLYHLYSGHRYKSNAQSVAEKILAPRGYRYRIVKGNKRQRSHGSKWVVYAETSGATRKRFPRR